MWGSAVRRRWRKWVDRYGLTAGELGAAASQTTVVALLPVLLAPYAPSAFWIGFAIGGEGFFALTVPFLVGLLSDRLRPALAQRFGRRTFFLMLAAPVMMAALVVSPFLSGYTALTAATFLFFASLHAYLTPLWALMIDAVPRQSRSRVQGMRGLLRSVGLAFGLVGGGLLQAVWRPLPFLLVALILGVTTAITWWVGRKAPSHPELSLQQRGLRELWRELSRNHGAVWFILANASWSGAIDGIRPYIFLFAVTVLGIGVGTTSAGLLLLVVGLGIGSFLVGHLGARLDRGWLLQIGVGVVCLALGIGFFARTPLFALGIVPLAGLGASAVVALAYPVFADHVGTKDIGQYTGLYVFSVGFGRIVAPMFVGLIIDLGAHVLPQQQGYPFMWVGAAALAVLGFLALWRSRRLGFRGEV